MPLVTVGPPAKFRAFPIATTSSPTSTLSESPSVTVGSPLASRILTRATSGPNWASPLPTTSAVRDCVSLNTVTRTVDALPTTWALVRTSPSGEMIIPVPAPLLVRIVTTAGSTLASRSRIWLPVMIGALFDVDPDEPDEDDGLPANGVTVLVLVPL